ncbi:hypothetical protein KQ878_03500 [Mycoplasma zalophidermidis]|uniref:Uncharacterized protein n=1 Tax=Mycoplasma zalophidermidis TaxID=398174 RepID=A0ABS6DTW8_9MOLU|nr:hypothetical protein [Mycoplasma zalophidermidis]MBU4690047.1 hypothetical protein [Mycoplasma zalophidermidis]MBU4693933.1 hypothetical protein [Mycoplasma zalophidermidis]
MFLSKKYIDSKNIQVFLDINKKYGDQIYEIYQRIKILKPNNNSSEIIEIKTNLENVFKLYENKIQENRQLLKQENSKILSYFEEINKKQDKFKLTNEILLSILPDPSVVDEENNFHKGIETNILYIQNNEKIIFLQEFIKKINNLDYLISTWKNKIENINDQTKKAIANAYLDGLNEEYENLKKIQLIMWLKKNISQTKTKYIQQIY